MQDQRGEEVDETSDLSLSQKCVRLADREIESSKNNNFEVDLVADKRPTIVIKGDGVALTSLRRDSGGWTCLSLKGRLRMTVK